MDGGTVIAAITIGILLFLPFSDRVFDAIRLARHPEERALLARARAARPVAANTQGLPAGMFCDNCRRARRLRRYRAASGLTYCSEECLIWGALGPSGFCAECVQT